MSYGITISIGNPTIHDPGMGSKHAKYASYSITSESTKSGFRPGSFTVDRRFSDFCWLTEEFARELPGCILPPLPEKVTVGRFEKEFLESRQRGLQRFLQRVIAHPELSSSHLLVIFLQSDEGAFTRAMDDSKASRPKITTAAVNWFEGKVNSIAYGKAEIDRSPEDVKIEEMAEYIQKLEKQFSTVAKHSEGFVKRLRDAGATQFELGSALSVLGQSDADDASGDLVQFASTIERTSNAYSTLSEAALVRFHEPMEDYVRLMGSVKAAIQRRADKKRAYVAALTDVDAKGAMLRKAQSAPGKDTSSKEAALQGAEAMRDAAKADFERVTERLLQEFESFKEKKVQDMRQLMANYVDFQASHTRSLELLWEEIAPRLQGQSVHRHSANSNNSNNNLLFSNRVPPPVPNSPPPVPPSNPFHHSDEETEQLN